MCNAIVAGLDTFEATLGENLKVSFILSNGHSAQGNITYLVRDVFAPVQGGGLSACVSSDNMRNTVYITLKFWMDTDV